MKHFTILITMISASMLAACSADIGTEENQLHSEQPPVAEIIHEPEIIEQPTPPQPVEPPKPIMGWVEQIQIGGVEHMLKAKLDSGAKTSSIDAEIIRRFKRNGQSHVVFRVNFGADAGGEQLFEAPIKRWVRIKKKGNEQEGYIRRPVVEMTFCLGDRKIIEEVNLAERGNFIYPVLIGRNMLRDNILVDTSKTFTQRPSCD